MKRKNATRSALFTSVLALLLCVSMLVGTTFAWFTDEVVTGMNTIVAGNLDVELYYSKAKDFADEKKVDGQTLLFTDKDGNEIKNWEPGVVAYTNLQVANVGTLALTYRMSLIFDNMNYVEYPDGSVYDLSDVLKVAIVDGGFEGDRAAAHRLAYDYSLESFHLAGELEGNTTTKTIGVVIYWEPGSNEHDNLFNMNNGKTTSDKEPLHVNLGINLFATQEEYEYDSFDDMYDEAADNTVAAGEVLSFNGDDVTESLRNNGTVNITGGTVKNDSYALYNNGVANLTDVAVEAGNASNYALISGAGAETNLNNVNLKSAGGGIGAADGAKVTFNSGSVYVDTASTSGRYIFYAEGEGTTITINGGEFSWDPADNQKRAYIYAGEGTTVYVNGGTFGKASTRDGYTAGILGTGNVIITGGTFGFNPTNWVAGGYEAVKNDSTWTVQPTGEDFTDILQKDAENIVVNLAGDVTYDVRSTGLDYAMGSAKTKTIIINGNGHTITFNGLASENNYINTYGAKLIINNANITATNTNPNTVWNVYDAIFACEVELNNVTSDKPLALMAGAALNNVTINNANDVYAMWIQPNGQTVIIDGLTVNAGRGIKIDEQYVTAEKVTLNVSNATFTTAKKAAIMVKSTAGADITLSDVNIANTVDSVHAVWVDADAAASYDLVTVTGGEKIYEGNVVSNATELTAAINAGNTKIYLLAGTFEFDWENRELLNGVTIIGTSPEDSTLLFTGYGPGSWYLNGLTLENVTVVDRCEPENGTYSYYHSYFDVSGLTATNVVFKTGVQTANTASTFTKCTFVSDYYWNYSTQDYAADEMYGLVANGDVNVNGCSFTGFRGIDVSADCTVAVTDSTFELTNTEKPAINVKNAGATVTVDGEVIE